MTAGGDEGLYRLERRFDRFAESMDLHFEQVTARMEASLDRRLAEFERRLTLRLGIIMVSGVALMGWIAKAP